MGLDPSSRQHPLATIGPAALVLDAGHNISPRLRKQLVLELEVGVEGLELVDELPRRILFRKTSPLDEHLPRAATLMCTKRLGWSWSQPAI